jgi:hypothetical protein
MADSTKKLLHYGLVVFDKNSYIRAAGSSNWNVHPIPGFGQAVGPPLAQVKIVFDVPLKEKYIVFVSPQRTDNTPMLCANSGNLDESGFIVHLFDPVGTRTLQNGNFSFLVLPQDM